MKLFLFINVLLFSNLAYAGVDAKQFNNPQQEAIYSNLIEELRCLVCQNQNIADSNAELAKDLRRQVYEMVQRGQSEQEIKDFMLQRYGDFVLYNPPLKTKTLFLWVGPFIFLILGGIAVFVYSRRKNENSVNSLSPGKQKEMQQLLEQGEDE